MNTAAISILIRKTISFSVLAYVCIHLEDVFLSTFFCMIMIIDAMNDIRLEIKNHEIL